MSKIWKKKVSVSAKKNSVPIPMTILILSANTVNRYRILVSHYLWVNYLPQWWVEFDNELCFMMSWVGCLLKDSDHFYLIAEKSQILLKISDIPILLTFMYLVVLNLLVNNQLNSSLWQIIDSLVVKNPRRQGCRLSRGLKIWGVRPICLPASKTPGRSIHIRFQGMR